MDTATLARYARSQPPLLNCILFADYVDSMFRSPAQSTGISTVKPYPGGVSLLFFPII